MKKSWLSAHHERYSSKQLEYKTTKAVVLLDLIGNTIERFQSAEQCGRKIGTKGKTVANCANGRQKTICNGQYTVKWAKNHKRERPNPF